MMNIRFLSDAMNRFRASRLLLLAALLLALLGRSHGLAGVEDNGYPSFRAGEILSTGASLAKGVRLRCEAHMIPTNWGEKMPQERHTNFILEFNPTPADASRWAKAGFVWVQFKDYRTSQDPYGRHLRIREVEVDADLRRRGIATQALKIVMAEFQAAAFDRYKSEISMFNPGSIALFTRLGFGKAEHLEEGFGDVDIYLMEKGGTGRGAARQSGTGTEKKVEPGACAACGKGGELKRCSGCKQVEYCDGVCQRNHWKAHKPACKPAPVGASAAAGAGAGAGAAAMTP